MKKITNKKQLMSELRMSFKGYYGKIIGRLIAIACAFLMILAMFIIIAVTFRESLDEKNLSNCRSICQRDYYARDFADMLDTLNLYDPNQTQLEKYWEIALTYENFTLYQLWEEASDRYPDHQEYREKSNDYAQLVLAAYDQSTDEDNKNIMKSYIKEIENNMD